MVEFDHLLQPNGRSSVCKTTTESPAGTGLDKNLTGVFKIDRKPGKVNS